MTPTLKKLRELAHAATPGPWNFYDNSTCELVVHLGDRQSACISTNDPEDYADAKYISAANPAAILKILDALEVLEFYAGNKGLRIDHESNVFKSSDSDDKDFHGARARAALEKLKEIET